MTGITRNWQPFKNDGNLSTERQYRAYATYLVDAAHDYVESNEGHTRYSLNGYYKLMYNYMRDYRVPNRGMSAVEELN